MARRGWFLVAVFFLALACAACAGSAVEIEPAEPVEEEPAPTLESATTEPLSTPTPPSPEPSPTPSVEDRTVEVEWPGSMRVGDGEVVRFSLMVSGEGTQLSTPEIAGHHVETATVAMPITWAGYKGYARASLSAAGLEVVEAGPSRQPLRPGGANTWRWTVAAPRAGTYHPVISLTVIWEPESGVSSGRSIEEMVWSRVLTVAARAPFGLSGPQVDWLGLGGTALGTAAGFPFMEKIVSTLWRRLRGRRQEENVDQ